MERLDRLIVYETDKGNYAVRPLNWAGCWDKDGKIKECGLNHIAVFHYKQDAEWYAETKNAEEQGLLLRLPCKVGDTVFSIFERRTECTEHNQEFDEYSCQGCECLECDSRKYKYIQEMKAYSLDWIIVNLSRFEKTIFLTREEAEKALEDMKGKV